MYFKWYCADSKRQAFHLSSQPSPTDHRITRYTLHRIRTTRSIGEIKTSPKVQSLLKDHNFFINKHWWNETEWDTIQLGFFFGLDPTVYDVDQATAKVTAEIQSQLPRQRIPKFKLSFTSPKVQSGRRTYRTKAYAIESDRSSSKEQIALLKQAYKSNGAFIPYQMRQCHPGAFKKLIQAQTQVWLSTELLSSTTLAKTQYTNTFLTTSTPLLESKPFFRQNLLRRMGSSRFLFLKKII
jgi:hypothetical protein